MPRRSITSRELRDRMYELTRDIEDEKQRDLYRGFINKELDTWRRKRLGDPPHPDRRSRSLACGDDGKTARRS